MERLDAMLAAYNQLQDDASRSAYRRQVRAHVVASGYQPHTQPPVNNGVPDSALEALDRRFTKWQPMWWSWNLGPSTDDAYLAQVKSEIARRESAPEPDRRVKERRARYTLDRENLSEEIPLSALLMKRRDLLLQRRYNPEGWGEADGEYMRKLKRLIKLQRYRKTNLQKEKAYEPVKHFKPETAEQKAEAVEELQTAEAAPGVRRSGRARTQATQFEAGQGGTLAYKNKPATAGVDDIEPDADRTRTAPEGYVPRQLEKQAVEDVLPGEEDDDDDAEPPPPVPEAERTSNSGMSPQQLERVTSLYYGDGDQPPMVASAASLYKLLLAEGDPPSLRQLQRWVSEQSLTQAYKPFHVKGGDVAPFTATKPLRNFGMDLFTATAYGPKIANQKGRAGRFWDGWGKSGGYGLVVIDEYSRLIFAEVLENKEAATVARALTKVLDRIQRLSGGKQIHASGWTTAGSFLGLWFNS